MTRHARLKQRIRARMAKTGERYTTARRHILAQREPLPAVQPEQLTSRWHFPGNIPAVTILRTLLSSAGILAPHSHEPFSEAMLFGIAGGIGIGVFSFFYEKEDYATFFLGGRHVWYDDARYLKQACERFGVTPVVWETSGAKTAEEHLRAALEGYAPVAAWVDSAALPYRAAPNTLSGGGYHVITVYEQDDATGMALIGDLADDPIAISRETLARARGRIKKDRHRLLGIAAGAECPPLDRLIWAGIRACYAELQHPGLSAAAGNVRLEALHTWAHRMEGASAKERWERIYRPGVNFFRGLCAIHDYVEHYGSGGGLCRPLFADFLAEAAEALQQPEFASLAERYAELGHEWSALADMALPDDVPLLQEAKALLTTKAGLLHAGGPVAEVQTAWTRLEALERQAADAFPLSDAACRELRHLLQARIVRLYEQEIVAQTAVAALLSQRA